MLETLVELAAAQRSVFTVLDDAGHPLWAGAACSADELLNPVERALDADDAEQAIAAQWAWVTRLSERVDQLPAGTAAVAFTGLADLPALEPGRPVQVGVTLHDRLLPECQGCGLRTFDATARLRCEGWAVEPARRVAITNQGTYALAFTVIPDAVAESCELVVSLTLRENAGRTPDEYTLPLRLGRAPAEASLTGVAGAVGTDAQSLPLDGAPTWRRSLLLNNFDAMAHTYTLDLEIDGAEGWRLFDGEATRRLDVEVPPQAELPTDQAEGFPVDVVLDGPADLAGGEAVELTARVVAIDNVPLAEPTTRSTSFVVTELAPCD